MSTVSVSLLGMKGVLSLLDAAPITHRAEQGLLDAADAMTAKAHANLAPHKYRGTTMRSTTTGPLEHDNTSHATVTVGIHGGMAPQGRPLEFGWRSESGRQPPTAAIAEWIATKHPAMALGTGAVRVKASKGGKFGPFLAAKGTAKTRGENKALLGIAFVIARSIGRKGYSFNKISWLGDAYKDIRPKVGQYIQRAVSRGTH